MEYYQALVRAVEYMESHLCEDISVEDVCIAARFSNWHFQRIFSEALGESIGSYLRRRRLAEALEDLQASEWKVIDIAFKFQFGSSEAFSRSFKKEFGLSPQQFRQRPIKIFPYKKPSLDANQIHYVMNEINIQPEIREVPSFTVVGLRVSFTSPLAQRSSYMEAVTRIWQEFVRRQNEIPHAEQKVKVGIIEGMASKEHHVHDEMMDYVAAAPCNGPLPDGFVSVTVPAGTYAVFTATGFHEQTQYIIDYVYSTWLHQAEYQRADGIEFTWLDHRANALSSITSRVEYFIPIQKKR